MLVGQFKDKCQELVTVLIHIPGAGVLSKIGGNSYEDADIYFDADSPVTIKTEVTDTFDVLQIKSCTINLYVRTYLGNILFTGDARNLIVNVWKNNKCLFSGFIEPNVYNQPYNKRYDSLNLQATDAIATLQYYPYRGIQTQQDYDEFRSYADKVSFETVVSNVLGKLPVLDLLNERPNSIYYDGSIRTSSTAAATSIWTDCYIYDLLWAGEEKDDLMNDDQVLEELLKYLDLHIIQEGCNFFIYNWATIRNRQTIDWYPIAISDSYYVSNSKMMFFDGDAREALVSVTDSTDVIPGNPLEIGYEDEINYVNGAYVNYQYAVLPDESTARTGKWRYADLGDWDFLYRQINGEDKFFILVQDPDGSYRLEELKLAPDQCYNEGYVGDFYNFKYDYFVLYHASYMTEDGQVFN